MNKVYVVVDCYAFEDDDSRDVIGVYYDKEDAKKAFSNCVNVEKYRLGEFNEGKFEIDDEWEIHIDTEERFHATEIDSYCGCYIEVSIQEVDIK